MTPERAIADGCEIEFINLPGQHNPIAVCSDCRRDATQTRISRYCIAALNHTPLLCDQCEEG